MKRILKIPKSLGRTCDARAEALTPCFFRVLVMLLCSIVDVSVNYKKHNSHSKFVLPHKFAVCGRMEINMGELTHFDTEGNAIMVDVSNKEITVRTAVAMGSIHINTEVMEAIVNHTVKKGDVLGVARVAGILAVKNTAGFIPMCHPLAINKCTIDFEVCREQGMINAVCTVKTEGRTGVEMEALTGVAVTLLTVYDMCKAIDKRMEITNIHLRKKTGGKSGDFSSERTFS